MDSRDARQGAAVEIRHSGNRDEKGIALLITIFVIALLATITFEMSYMTLVDVNVARNVAEDTRLTFLAEAGIGAARAVLAIDKKNNKTDNLSEVGPEGAPIRALPLGDALVAIDIVDEESKIPLNALVTTTGQETKVNAPLLASLQRLFTQLGIDPEITDAIVDWVDPDDIPYGKEGAESAFYKNLETPYPVRNGPFLTLEELRLVREVTPEVFNKISPFVTVYPTSGKVNINTASKTVLMAMSDEMDETRVKELIDYRTDTPFESPEKAKSFLSGFSPPLTDAAALGNLFDVKSDYFSITSSATLQPAEGTGTTNEKGLGGDESTGTKGSTETGKGSGAQDLSVRQQAQRAGNTKSILAVLKRGDGGKGELLYWRVD